MTDRYRDPRIAFILGVLLALGALAGCSSDDEPSPAAIANDPPVTITPDQPAAAVAPGAPVASGADCCSCAVTQGTTVADPRLPCLFDIPVDWRPVVGDDGMLISAVAAPPPCDTVCQRGSPAMSASYGLQADSNADERLNIWPMAMRVVGDARCGEGTVQFFSPPGADETGLIGGLKFYVQLDGKKYGGAAQFTCGQPGGWVRLRDMFIDSFRDNPESTFPNRP